MSRRSSDLFEELQSIFGESFGYREDSLTESMNEGAKHARGRDDRPIPSDKNAISKRQRQQSGYKSVPRKESQRSLKRKADKEKSAAAAGKYRKDAEAKGKQGPEDFRKDWDAKHAARSKSDSKPKSKPSSGDGAKAQASGGGKGSTHDPFKNSPNLGPGPREQHHDETKCWNCTCPGNIYSSGCNCKSSGKGENCPPKGTLKKISYKKDYKKKYNDQYHAWRAGKKGEVTRRTSGR